MVTVFSLSVSTYVGAPPSRRNVTSSAANTVGHRSCPGSRSTTRNRDHASHAQNSTVFTPSMTGPSPKSYCNHIPGSVTHGRCTRTRPSAVVRLHRRDRPPGRALRPGEPQRDQLVVRDVGADLAVRALDPLLDLRQELIDQLRPRRGPVASTRPPHGRRRTGPPCGASTPASSPASRNDPVRSNASNIFMISSADFTVSLLGGGRRISTANRTRGGASTAGRGEADELVSGRSHDRQRATSRDRHRAATWPSPGSFPWPLSSDVPGAKHTVC